MAAILFAANVLLGLFHSPVAVTHANLSPLGHINAEPIGAVTDSSISTLREVIPAKYQKKYLKWKHDYLSTVEGRTQWERYTLNPNFILTITISREEAEGARVDRFLWDDLGNLVGATIILGNRLDSGYPSSINYPITCSLAPGNLPPEVKGTILAATKLAHEFGHLNRTMSMNGRIFTTAETLDD